MKVFKIIKYHICYNNNGYAALCGKDSNIFITRHEDYIGYVTTVSTLTGKQKITEYHKDMDLCKTCRQMNFEKMVNKLKGRG